GRSPGLSLENIFDIMRSSPFSRFLLLCFLQGSAISLLSSTPAFVGAGILAGLAGCLQIRHNLGMLKNKAPAAKAVKRKKASPDSSVFALKMMQALPDAVLAFPWDGKIAFANEAAEALFGQAAKKLTDLFLSDIIDTTDPVYDA